MARARVRGVIGPEIPSPPSARENTKPDIV